MKFKELIVTFNAGDIALIKSLLENAQIEYYAQGKHFNQMRPLVEPVRFMVKDFDFETARKIIGDLKLQYTSLSVTKKIEGSNQQCPQQLQRLFYKAYFCFRFIVPTTLII